MVSAKAFIQLPPTATFLGGLGDSSPNVTQPPYSAISHSAPLKPEQLHGRLADYGHGRLPGLHQPGHPLHPSSPRNQAPSPSHPFVLRLSKDFTGYRPRRANRTFHHTISGVIATVGNIQVTQTGLVSTLTTSTAVTVAMVPPIMLVRCREIRRT